MNLHPRLSSELARYRQQEMLAVADWQRVARQPRDAAREAHRMGSSHFLRRVLLPVTLLCLCALLTASCHGGGYRRVLAPGPQPNRSPVVASAMQAGFHGVERRGPNNVPSPGSR